MRRNLFLALIFCLLLVPSSSLASDPAQLKLFKVNEFTLCSICGEFYPVFENQDVSSLASYSQFLQDNEYNLTFWGDPGSTVTIFGSFDYVTDKGYLIVHKLDDQPIYLYDLEKFPENEWTEVGAKGVSKGKFLAYYQPYENFKTNISSVKWGQWWPDSVEK